MDFAAKQARQFAADSKTEAGAAVFPASAGIGLLEGFKNQPLLVGGDSAAGGRASEGDHCRGSVENRGFRTPAPHGGRDLKTDAAFTGKLECVRQQILQYLLQ